VACDMTSVTPTTLVRQYWSAVFLPIMRVHQMFGTPRFPFLWGGPEHHAAFRAALNTRYTFLPHLYSLAHAGFAARAPLAAPASWIFPDEPTFPAAVGDGVYMVGDSLLPAELTLAEGGHGLGENTTTAYLPPGAWFRFNSTAALPGLQRVTDRDVPLDALVLFVRAGAILALQAPPAAGARPPQRAAALGGALALHVYAGRDAAFTLVEDDGESKAYATDPLAARATRFTWHDGSRTLAWTVSGGAGALPNAFVQMLPTLFVANASAPLAHAPATLGRAGSITWGA